jgi:hypothetical protein
MSKTPQDTRSPTVADKLSEDYLGRWNHLVSTTNWEKGQIIFQWRADLEVKSSPTGEFSDEAWSRRVGNVSPQHVGRLRRVFTRFNKVWQDYPGLYWSHFQSAVEWADAELWLEGASQNRWSVSQMRYARWEAMGAPADQKPRDRDIITAELDEDRSLGTDEKQVTTARTATVRDPGGDTETFAPDYGEAQDASPEQVAQSVSGRDEPPQIRPFAELPTLPADVSDSFESFKLAILHHKMQGWEEVHRDDVVSTLEALKELALAP